MFMCCKEQTEAEDIMNRQECFTLTQLQLIIYSNFLSLSVSCKYKMKVEAKSADLELQN